MHELDYFILSLEVLAVCFIDILVNIILLIIRRKQKKKRRRSVIALITSALLTAGCILFLCSHPLYYKYNDWWVKRHSREEIRERYGAFDLERGNEAGYFIYWANVDHYYYIVFDENDTVTKVYTGPQPGG